MKYQVLLVAVLLLFVILTYRTYHLPKIVWTHWDTAKLPDFQRLNLDRTKRHLPDWQVNLVTDATFASMCPSSDFPPKYDELSKQHKADFIRLWLLKQYGGCWMDSSVILNQSLNDLHSECLNQKAELSGFYIEGLTTDTRWPVFENWFIMAPTHSRVIQAWYEEYYTAIAKGFQFYQDQVGRNGLHFHNLLKYELYLTQHICFQQVIQKRIQKPNILYKRAEDSMYRIHADCNWDAVCMRDAFRQEDIKRISYIKLRGGDRDLFPIQFFSAS
jgi:hypothetical protein